MERYTTYKSAVHAGCCVMQLDKGIDEGLEWCNNLLDLGTLDGGCDAILLAEMLRAEGIRCIPIEISPFEIDQFLDDAMQVRRLTLFQMRAAANWGSARWAITQSSNSREIRYGICLGYGETQPMRAPLSALCTGQVVALGQSFTPDRGILAHVWHPEPSRN